jgi:hypothetical protein
VLKKSAGSKFKTRIVIAEGFHVPMVFNRRVELEWKPPYAFERAHG